MTRLSPLAPWVGGALLAAMLATAALTSSRFTAWVGDAPVANHRTTPAPVRPALGFTFGRTDRAAVLAWASSRGATCTEVGPVGMRCTGVGALPVGDAPAAVNELLLRFDTGDQLVAVDAAVHGLDAGAADAWVTSATEQLQRQLGPPRDWKPGGPGWAKGALSQIASTFRFADYRADIRATELEAGRIVVRATFQAT